MKDIDIMTNPFNLDLDGVRKKNASLIMLLEDAFSNKLLAQRDLQNHSNYPRHVRIKLVKDRDTAKGDIARISSKLYNEIRTSVPTNIRYTAEGLFHAIYQETKARVEESINGEPQHKNWLWIVAGPNGAGKSTFVNSQYGAMAGNLPLINPDIIAKQLNPDDVESVLPAAGRQAISEIRDNLESGQSFIVETTGAGGTYLKYAKMAKEAGWHVGFVYVTNNHSDISIDRVKRRVSEGGHDVPEDVIVRRWHSSHKNVPKFVGLSDFAVVIDNSIEQESDDRFCMVASGSQGRLIHIRKKFLPELMDTLHENSQTISMHQLMDEIHAQHKLGGIGC